MPIPTKAQFDAAINITEEYFAIDLVQRIEALRLDSLGIAAEFHDEIRAILEEFDARRGECISRFDSSPVMKWLALQPAFDSAFHSCFGSNRRSKRSPYSDRRPKLNETLFEKAIASEDGMMSILYLLRQNLSKVWLARIVDALREYFYTDHAEDIVHGLKSLDEMEHEIHRIGDAISCLAHAVTGKSFGNSADRMLRQIEMIRSLSVVDQFKRSSQNVNERLLVKRLADTNKRYFGNVKAEAIAEMMMIEGIAHPVDLRTIQRWCSKPARLVGRVTG